MHKLLSQRSSSLEEGRERHLVAVKWLSGGSGAIIRSLGPSCCAHDGASTVDHNQQSDEITVCQ